MWRCSFGSCCWWCSLSGLAATAWIYKRVPTGFIPQEDQGYLMVIVQAPPGSSLAYTTALADRAQAVIGAESQTLSAHFPIMGFSFTAERVQCGTDVYQHETCRPGSQGQRPYRGGHCCATLRQSCRCCMFQPRWWSGRGDSATGGAGRGQLWRLPVHAAGYGREHDLPILTAWRTRLWGPARARKDADRVDHNLFSERSAGAGDD